nr:immunoglobulin light chain junction region [Macaca mulatta]MOX22229.1 immunoglobulin light chain junction region [Macaca mulatta]
DYYCYSTDISGNGLF